MPLSIASLDPDPTLPLDPAGDVSVVLDDPDHAAAPGYAIAVLFDDGVCEVAIVGNTKTDAYAASDVQPLSATVRRAGGWRRNFTLQALVANPENAAQCQAATASFTLARTPQPSPFGLAMA